jgi:hypothetical protein
VVVDLLARREPAGDQRLVDLADVRPLEQVGRTEGDGNVGVGPDGEQVVAAE